DGDDRLFIPRENYLLNFIFAHHTVERINHLFGMMQVIIFGVPLIAHLRPAANLSALGLWVLHLFVVNHLPAHEDEDLRGVCVRQEYCVTWVLTHEARERVEVRLVIDKQTVALNGYVQLRCLEEISSARAGENHYAVGR